MHLNRRTHFIIFVVLMLGVGAWGYTYVLSPKALPPVRIGILHSLTGTMAISERPVVDAALMAIEEINQEGGLLGRQLEAVLADGKSNENEFRRQAERLIRDEKVSVLFGCWTSASRKTVKTVVEKYDHLLIYPVQYEGLERSSNIVYTGAAPNQQIIPAVNWAMSNIGKRLMLVGSDYIFPRTANLIIRHLASSMNGIVLDEKYIPLGSEDVSGVVDRIRQLKPDVILNTINGHTNVAFFRELRKQGITPDQIPTLSFSFGEHELQSMREFPMAGDYAAWSYFESISLDANKKFVGRFKEKYGEHRVVDDPIQTEYFSLKLWAKAVKMDGSFDPRGIRQALRGVSLTAPEGYVHIDLENSHAWRMVRIGKIGADGQFKVVWSSSKAVRPVPFPVYRSQVEWKKFLNRLHDMWGGRWSPTST